MKPPFPAVEGQLYSLGQVFPNRSTASEELLLRRQIARLSDKLRLRLKLREDPLVVVDSATAGIRFRGLAGTVRLGSVEVEISPKYVEYEHSPSADWRASLILMLERSAPRRVAFSRSRQLQLRHRTFLDQFAHSFAVELADASAGEPIRQYRSLIEESKFVRGRIVINQQLRRSVSRPDLVVSEIDVLDTVNPQNQLLRWTANDLLSRVTDPLTKRLLLEQLGKLPHLEGISRLPARVDTVVPRQYLHYRGALQLAAAYARGTSTYPGLANIEGAAFVVGTEKLFESYIEKSLIAVAGSQLSDGWNMRAQAREVFAYGVGHNRNFFSKPDNILDVEGIPRLIIDAKYKKFSDATDQTMGSKPSNGDLYQMAAACAAHGVDRALLVYPRLVVDDGNESPPWNIRWWRSKSIRGSAFHIGAVSVDLSTLKGPQTLPTFDNRLKTVVLQALNQSYPPVPCLV